jgi:hypothetical protein
MHFVAQILKPKPERRLGVRSSLLRQVTDKISVSPNLFGGVLRMESARRRALGLYCPENASDEAGSASAE